MGRTGTLFACEQDVAPDIVAIAKGLGAGYQPIGAMLATERSSRPSRPAAGFFQHGHTYMGHPTACAAALAVQRTIEAQGLLDNVARMGASCAPAGSRFGNHHHVGDIRGRGLFRAMPGRIKRRPSRLGCSAIPAGGTIDGRRGVHVLLAPPFIISDDQIGELCDGLEAAAGVEIS